MRRIVIILLGTLLAIECFGQQDGNGKKYRIDEKKPSVSLEYVCETKDSIQLQIHNNSIWNITVWTKEQYFGLGKRIVTENGRTVYAIPNGQHAWIFYSTEDDRKKSRQNQNGGGGTIVPDSTIYFSVLRSHLGPKQRIFVEFAYEWDGVGDLTSEPQHRVYFPYTGIPKRTVRCNA